MDNTGQVRDQSSLEVQPDGTYALQTTPGPGSGFICFAKGTHIMTACGARAIETLSFGDEVVTKDHGLQQIRWIGSRTLHDAGRLADQDMPITIQANAFGPGVPHRATQFSPNHAVLLEDWRASIYFGEDEVLTAAKSLLNADFAHRARRREVTYFHILLDQHSLVQANGMWAESLYLGDQCMHMLSPDYRAQIQNIFPHIRGNLGGYGQTTRQVVRPHHASLFA